MSKIPDDIMRLAIDISIDPKTPAVPTNSFPGAVTIAEAVLRERERCAQIADIMPFNAQPRDIATRIRSGA